MISMTIIMGMISGFCVFSGLVMANALDPDLRTPSLEQVFERSQPKR